MKLYFDLGMQYVFGYVEEVNSTGPVIAWQLVKQLNDYLQLLHDNGQMKWGRKYNNYNMKIFSKLVKLRGI